MASPIVDLFDRGDYEAAMASYTDALEVAKRSEKTTGAKVVSLTAVAPPPPLATTTTTAEVEVKEIEGEICLCRIALVREDLFQGSSKALKFLDECVERWSRVKSRSPTRLQREFEEIVVLLELKRFATFSSSSSWAYHVATHLSLEPGETSARRTAFSLPDALLSSSSSSSEKETSAHDTTSFRNALRAVCLLRYDEALASLASFVSESEASNDGLQSWRRERCEHLRRCILGVLNYHHTPREVRVSSWPLVDAHDVGDAAWSARYRWYEWCASPSPSSEDNLLALLTECTKLDASVPMMWEIMGRYHLGLDRLAKADAVDDVFFRMPSRHDEEETARDVVKGLKSFQKCVEADALNRTSLVALTNAHTASRQERKRAVPLLLSALSLAESGEPHRPPRVMREAMTWIFLRLGQIYMHLTDFSQAAYYLTRALNGLKSPINETTPGIAAPTSRLLLDEVMVSLGEAFLQTGRLNAASELLERACEGENEGAEEGHTRVSVALSLLTRCRMELGDFEGAITVTRRLLSRLSHGDDFETEFARDTRTNLAEALLRLTQWHLARGSVSLALDCVTEAKQIITGGEGIRPEMRHKMLGEVLSLTRSIEEVRGITANHRNNDDDDYVPSSTVYLEAIRNEPWSAIARYDCVKAALSSPGVSNPAVALSQALASVELCPTDAINWNLLGCVFAARFFELEFPAEAALKAQHCFLRALQLDELDAETWMNLGTLYARCGALEEARAAFARAQSSQPDSPLAWLSQAKLFERDNRVKPGRVLAALECGLAACGFRADPVALELGARALSQLLLLVSDGMATEGSALSRALGIAMRARRLIRESVNGGKAVKRRAAITSAFVLNALGSCFEALALRAEKEEEEEEEGGGATIEARYTIHDSQRRALELYEEAATRLMEMGETRALDSVLLNSARVAPDPSQAVALLESVNGRSPPQNFVGAMAYAHAMGRCLERRAATWGGGSDPADAEADWKDAAFYYEEALRFREEAEAERRRDDAFLFAYETNELRLRALRCVARDEGEKKTEGVAIATRRCESDIANACVACLSDFKFVEEVKSGEGRKVELAASLVRQLVRGLEMRRGERSGPLKDALVTLKPLWSQFYSAASLVKSGIEEVENVERVSLLERAAAEATMELGEEMTAENSNESFFFWYTVMRRRRRREDTKASNEVVVAAKRALSLCGKFVPLSVSSSAAGPVHVVHCVDVLLETNAVSRGGEEAASETYWTHNVDLKMVHMMPWDDARREKVLRGRC